MNSKLFKFLLVGILLFLIAKISAQPCVKIESILVAACTNPGLQSEGSNEMFRFRVGNTPLNTANMNITWGSGQYGYSGLVKNVHTGNIVTQMNNTIQSCGFLIEPVNGILPANSQVLMFCGLNVSTTANSFAQLSDTLYVIFQNATNPGGHFLNYATIGVMQQTTTLSFNNIPGCSSTATYFRNQLLMTNGMVGDQPGATVNFDQNMNPTYINNGCVASFQPLSAAWTAPNAVCVADSPINLNNLVTGTQGGVWSGVGVVGNTFNPSGLTGSASITYTVVNAACQGNPITNTQTITINPVTDASFDIPENVCSYHNSINLNTYVTGTANGIWSGQSITSTGIFNPTGLNGAIPITYTTGVGNCQTSLVKNIQVNSRPPKVIITGNTVYCEGDNIENIQATVDNGSTIRWYSDAAMSNLIFTGNPFTPDISQHTNFWVTQTANTCVSLPETISLTIHPTPIPPSIPAQFSFCFGQPIPLMTATGNGGTIQWYSDQSLTNLVNTGNSYQAENISLTNFWLTQTINDCPSIAVSTILFQDFIDTDFEVSDSIGIYPLEVEFYNLSDNSFSCTWQLNGIGNSFIEQGFYTFEKEGIYNVTLICTSPTGCIGQKTQKIVVAIPDISLYIPNSFSPNADGLNDVFKVLGEGIVDFHIEIFNRWGEMVYQSFDFENGWDGKIRLNNKIAPQGIYVYQIQVTDKTKKTENFSGRILLLR
jgi:gliding motility-associated-like protein